MMVKANTSRGVSKKAIVLGKKRMKHQPFKNRDRIRIKSVEETREDSFELGPSNAPAERPLTGYWSVRIDARLPDPFHNMGPVMKSKVSQF